MNMFFFKWISPEEVGREWRVTQSLCLLSSSMYSFWMTLWPSGTPIRHSKTPPEWKMLLSRITDVICNCPIDWSMISMCGHQVTDWIQLTVAWSRISRWFCCLLFVDIDVFLNHVFLYGIQTFNHHWIRPEAFSAQSHVGLRRMMHVVRPLALEPRSYILLKWCTETKIWLSTMQHGSQIIEWFGKIEFSLKTQPIRRSWHIATCECNTCFSEGQVSALNMATM